MDKAPGLVPSQGNEAGGFLSPIGGLCADLEPVDLVEVRRRQCAGTQLGEEVVGGRIAQQDSGCSRVRCEVQ